MRSNPKPTYKITRKGKFIFSFLILLLCILLFIFINPWSSKDTKTASGDGEPPALSKQHKQDTQAPSKESIPIPNQKVSVYFNIKSSDLNEKAQQNLAQILSLSKEFPKAKIIIEGNAATNFPDDPDKHSAKENFEISMARGEAVKDYLISQGISEELISVKANGSTKPINSNTTTAQRSENRRADVFFTE